MKRKNNNKNCVQQINAQNPFEVRMLMAPFYRSWDEFDTAVITLPFQRFVVRSSKSVVARNIQIKRRLENRGERRSPTVNLLPASLQFYFKTYVCTHSKAILRGANASTSSTHCTGCPCKIHGKAIVKEDGSTVISVKTTAEHNHQIDAKISARCARRRDKPYRFLLKEDVQSLREICNRNIPGFIERDRTAPQDSALATNLGDPSPISPLETIIDAMKAESDSDEESEANFDRNFSVNHMLVHGIEVQDCS